MLLQEAMWIGKNIYSLENKDVFPLLNFGSSTELFRKEQPYINEFIFKPAKHLRQNVVHLDIKNGEGVDIVGDIFDNYVYNQLLKRNIKKILGEYIPSPKNTLAKNFFKQQGFMSKGKSGGTTKWEGDVNTLNGHYPEWFTVRQRS